MPAAEGLASLSGALNRQHGWFFAAQEARRLNDARRRGSEAFGVLAAVIPELLAALAVPAAQGDAFAGLQLRAAQRADAFIASWNADAFLRADTLPDDVRDWRWLAEVLPADIEAALDPVNPGLSLGRSKGGPLSRVLAAVIRSISGEKLTPTAVGDHLIKRAKVKRATAE